MKIKSLFLLSAIVLSLVACKEIPSVPDTSHPESQKPEQYEIPANRVTPDNGEMRNYYVSYKPEGDDLSALRRYCRSDQPSAELSDAFQNAVTISTVSVLGTNLEMTRLFVGVFSGSDATAEAFLMCRSQDGDLSELNSAWNRDDSPISNKACTESLTDLYRNYPDFQLQGIICDMSGWQAMYPVGAADGRYLQYYSGGSLHDFSRVDPFQTIEEGRQAINGFLKKRAQVLSEIPIYAWKTEEACSYLGISGYLSRFQGETVGSMSRSAEELAYLEDYDNLILVPLLDASGTENVYQLLLLYRHNDLIAEIVLEREPADGSIRLVRETVSPQNEQGDYIGLTECIYEREVRSLLCNSDNQSVRGVTLIPNGYRLIFD